MNFPYYKYYNWKQSVVGVIRAELIVQVINSMTPSMNHKHNQNKNYSSTHYQITGLQTVPGKDDMLNCKNGVTLCDKNTMVQHAQKLFYLLSCINCFYRSWFGSHKNDSVYSIASVLCYIWILSPGCCPSVMTRPSMSTQFRYKHRHATKIYSIFV